METCEYVPIAILNVNGLSAPIKRYLNGYRLKVRGQKRVYYAGENKNKAKVVLLISDKIDLKTKTTTYMQPT